MSWTCREEASRAYAPWPAVHDGAQTAALHIIQHLKPILSSQLRAASSSLRDMAGTALGSLSKVVVRQVSGRKPGGCQMPHSPEKHREADRVLSKAGWKRGYLLSHFGFPVPDPGLEKSYKL